MAHDCEFTTLTRTALHGRRRGDPSYLDCDSAVEAFESYKQHLHEEHLSEFQVPFLTKQQYEHFLAGNSGGRRCGLSTTGDQGSQEGEVQDRYNGTQGGCSVLEDVSLEPPADQGPRGSFSNRVHDPFFRTGDCHNEENRGCVPCSSQKTRKRPSSWTSLGPSVGSHVGLPLHSRIRPRKNERAQGSSSKKFRRAWSDGNSAQDQQMPDQGGAAAGRAAEEASSVLSVHYGGGFIDGQSDGGVGSQVLCDQTFWPSSSGQSGEGGPAASEQVHQEGVGSADADELDDLGIFDATLDDCESSATANPSLAMWNFGSYVATTAATTDNNQQNSGGQTDDQFHCTPMDINGVQVS